MEGELLIKQLMAENSILREEIKELKSRLVKLECLGCKDILQDPDRCKFCQESFCCGCTICLRCRQPFCQRHSLMLECDKHGICESCDWQCTNCMRPLPCISCKPFSTHACKLCTDRICRDCIIPHFRYVHDFKILLYICLALDLPHLAAFAVHWVVHHKRVDFYINEIL